MPIILVLYDVSKEQAFWVAVQRYFRNAGQRKPKQGAKKVRLFVPMSQRLNRKGIGRIRQHKQELAQFSERGEHEKD